MTGVGGKVLDPTAVNWDGNLRDLNVGLLLDRIHALALSIANAVSAGYPHDNGVIAKYTAAINERDRRVFGDD